MSSNPDGVKLFTMDIDPEIEADDKEVQEEIVKECKQALSPAWTNKYPTPTKQSRRPKPPAWLLEKMRSAATATNTPPPPPKVIRVQPAPPPVEESEAHIRPPPPPQVIRVQPVPPPVEESEAHIRSPPPPQVIRVQPVPPPVEESEAHIRRRTKPSPWWRARVLADKKAKEIQAEAKPMEVSLQVNPKQDLTVNEQLKGQTSKEPIQVLIKEGPKEEAAGSELKGQSAKRPIQVLIDEGPKEEAAGNALKGQTNKRPIQVLIKEGPKEKAAGIELKGQTAKEPTEIVINKEPEEDKTENELEGSAFQVYACSSGSQSGSDSGLVSQGSELSLSPVGQDVETTVQKQRRLIARLKSSESWWRTEISKKSDKLKEE